MNRIKKNLWTSLSNMPWLVIGEIFNYSIFIYWCHGWFWRDWQLKILYSCERVHKLICLNFFMNTRDRKIYTQIERKLNLRKIINRILSARLKRVDWNLHQVKFIMAVLVVYICIRVLHIFCKAGRNKSFRFNTESSCMQLQVKYHWFHPSWFKKISTFCISY